MDKESEPSYFKHFKIISKNSLLHLALCADVNDPQTLEAIEIIHQADLTVTVVPFEIGSPHLNVNGEIYQGLREIKYFLSHLNE